MSTGLSIVEVWRMIVMTILSVLSLGHLIYLLYANIRTFTSYDYYLYADIVLVLIAGSLYLFGFLSSLCPRTGIGKSAGLKFFVFITFLALIFLLVRGALIYRRYHKGWYSCSEDHACIKDLFGAFVPALIYNVCLLFFVSIDAFSNFAQPKQDQRSLPMMYNNHELNR